MRSFLIFFLIWSQFSLVAHAATEDDYNGILLYLPSIIGTNQHDDQTPSPKISSFPIEWPFPRNTLLGGINYFDHNQTNNFDPWNGYYDSGLAKSYFCRENADQFKVEFFNVDGQNYWVRQTYGHHGTDYYLPVGTPILAVADGRVSVRNDDKYERDRIKIYHDNGWVTIYAHSLIRNSSLHDQRVKAGDQIAIITDAALELDRGYMEIDGTMFWELHFEIYRPNSDNDSGYSSVDPYYGSCSHPVANPDRTGYFSNGAPLEFLPTHIK